MSGVNGDKSRFHRERKQKIARRIRGQKLLQALAEQHKAKSAAPSAKVEPVSA